MVVEIFDYKDFAHRRMGPEGASVTAIVGVDYKLAVLGLALLAGCASPPVLHRSSSSAVVTNATAVCSDDGAADRVRSGNPELSLVAYQSSADSALETVVPAAPLPTTMISPDPCDPFAGRAELSLDILVIEVQSRNPSLQAASAAWRAAVERYPQAVSLDDPMFGYMISPTGVGMDNGGGWMAQASQQIPWPGKRGLKGCAAVAEADVMQGDIGDTRLRLAEAARMAFFSYYLASRQAEVNDSTRNFVNQIREIAANKYQVGQVMQQDVLQADVELADLATRTAELNRDRQIATARINTLLHRPADYPLPPPPRNVPLPMQLPPVEYLQQVAEQARPDLYAQLARIRAEEANLALAQKEYYPDVNLVGKYDGFMPQDMRPQVGMDINLPIRGQRRNAAVREASHRVAQRRAEYQDRQDQVRYEVQAAHTQAVQAAEVIRLYRDRTLPAAQRSLESAQANYTTGGLDFLRLLDAQRQLNNQRERYYASLAEYHRRLAELERAVGAPAH